MKPFLKHICRWQVVLLFSAVHYCIKNKCILLKSSTCDTDLLCICYTLCHNKSNYFILKWHSVLSQGVKLFSLHLHPLYSIYNLTHGCTSEKNRKHGSLYLPIHRNPLRQVLYRCAALTLGYCSQSVCNSCLWWRKDISIPFKHP